MTSVNILVFCVSVLIFRDGGGGGRTPLPFVNRKATSGLSEMNPTLYAEGGKRVLFVVNYPHYPYVLSSSPS